MYYKQEDIDKLLDNLKIEEVVGEFIELKNRIQARKALDHGRGLILTERVVRETTWGAHYAHRPGVTVARRSQDVLDAVSRIIEDRQALALRW